MRPEPRQRSQRDFEHARPVDAGKRRVRAKPRSELRKKTLAVSALAGQPESPAQHQPVLMAIQFPDDLVIAARRIEVRHARPERVRRAAVVDRIERPVRQGGTAWSEPAEPKPTIAEQVVFAGEDAVGAQRRVTSGAGKLVMDARGQCVLRVRADRKASRSSPEVAHKGDMRGVPPLRRKVFGHCGQFSRRHEPREQVLTRPARGNHAVTPAIDERPGGCRATPAELAGVHPRQLRERAANHDARCRAAASSDAGANSWVGAETGRSTPR